MNVVTEQVTRIKPLDIECDAAGAAEAAANRNFRDICNFNLSYGQDGVQDHGEEEGSHIFGRGLVTMRPGVL